jgi:hypothetical protein
VRTTIRLKGDLLRHAKQRAAATNRTFTSFVEDAVRAALAPRTPGRLPRKRVELPVSGRGGTLPGVNLDDSASLHDLLDGIR